MNVKGKITADYEAEAKAKDEAEMVSSVAYGMFGWLAIALIYQIITEVIFN